LWSAVDDPRGLTPSPWVLAESFEDPGDDAVFGAAFAVQLLDGEPWYVRGVLRQVSSRPPAMSRIAVEHFTDPARQPSGSVLRRLTLGAIRDEALAELVRRGHAIGAMKRLTSASERADARRVGEIAAEARPRGPHGGYSRELYRRIAERYLELVAANRRDPINALCEEEGTKRETMRDWIRKATRMGYLAPGQPGVAGRSPGPKLNPKSKEGNDDG
jgi:hypothetical protein